MAKIDRNSANELSITPKVIKSTIIWQPESQSFRLKQTVLAPELNKILELRGYIGNRKYSFTLLFEKLPIRRFDNHNRHTSFCDGQLYRVSHKHTWDALLEDNCVYVPDDIDTTADINDQFLQFLAEQNISYHQYQRVMVSGR